MGIRCFELLIFVFAVGCFVLRTKGDVLVLPEGENESIVCTALDDDNLDITWRVNGRISTDDEDMRFVVEEEVTSIDDGLKGSTIIFNATIDVNNTNLSCVVSNIAELTFMVPLEIIITIQGTLPVPDVEYTMGDGSILFSWSPPFSHNITDVEPDISHYLVTIINTEEHHSVLTVNTTDTEYLLQSQDCQLSDYQVEIAAVNVVGVGDKYTSPPLTLDELVITSSDVFLGKNNPVIIIQVHTSCHINLDLSLSPRFSEHTIYLTSDNVSKEETTLNISSSEIKFKEYYTAIVTVDGLDSFSHKLNFSTFDVQDMVIEEKRSEHEITCYLAPGSQTKGCRIVIIQEGRGGDCEFNTTATRLEGAGDARVNVELPAGEYSVVVYDDEQEENPAYTTTLSIPGDTTTSVVGCVFDVLVVESTSVSEENNLLLVTGTVSTVALIVVLTLIAVISLVVLSRKCIGRKTAESVSARGVRKKQQQTTQFNMDNNPVYVVHKLPQSVSLTEQQRHQQQQQQQQESEFDMNHNPLYMLHTRPQHKNNPSADHEYETVQPLP